MAPKPLLDPTAPQPVGPLVDTSAAREPKAAVLRGHFGRVEKLDPARHRNDLWQAFTGHDQIWTYLAYGPFADAEAFALWLKARAGITDPFSYVVIDKAGHACGIIALMAVRPQMRVIEIGNIVLSPALQRTLLATEAQYLIARFVFEILNYRRYEWKCDARNAASRRAAATVGLQLRRPVLATHDRQGPQPRHHLVRHAGYRMAVAETRLRALARAREFRRRRPPEGQAVGRDPAEIAEASGQRLGRRQFDRTGKSPDGPLVAWMKRSEIRECRSRIPLRSMRATDRPAARR